MRKLIMAALLPVACMAATQTMAHSPTTDSTKIIHANDGDVSEWNLSRFETDPATKLLYAVDHDASYLYMAMKVTDPEMQVRIAMSGMKMFIDTRGKKKEGTGLEFPLRKEGGYGPPPQDVAQLRQKMTFNMILLRSFGFDDKEDKTGFIGEAGSINIAYKWDADNTLCIEYKIPMEYVGEAGSLKNKTLSIGWKVNEASPFLTAWSKPRPEGSSKGAAPEMTEEIVASRMMSMPAGGGGGRGPSMGRSGGASGGMAGTGGRDAAGPTAEVKGQYIWTRHLVSL